MTDILATALAAVTAAAIAATVNNKFAFFMDELRTWKFAKCESEIN